MTRYREGFSWPWTVEKFLNGVVRERPVLHVCCGKSTWGDCTVDRYEASMVRADWLELPFRDASFGCVFADPPWDAAYKPQCAAFVREALRVAPVAYLMAPWTYGASWVELKGVWVRHHIGVERPILVCRYVRAQLEL